MTELVFKGKTRSGRKLFGVFKPTSKTEGDVMGELFKRHCQAYDDIHDKLPSGKWTIGAVNYMKREATLTNGNQQRKVTWKHGQPMSGATFDVPHMDAS